MTGEVVRYPASLKQLVELLGVADAGRVIQHEKKICERVDI
jgi:hypothetical protein